MEERDMKYGEKTSSKYKRTKKEVELTDNILYKSEISVGILIYMMKYVTTFSNINALKGYSLTSSYMHLP